MKIEKYTTLIIIVIIIVLLLLLLLHKSYYESFTQQYTINDIYLYIFSWKRVNDNAVNIYKTVSQIFPNTYFLNCDEHFNAAAHIPKEHLIQLDDSYFFGGQFGEAIKHCPRGKIYGNIVGDVDPSTIDWVKLADSMLYAINSLNGGVIAPDASNFPGLGAQIEGSYYEVSDTDSTIFFIVPEIWDKYKNFPYKEITHFGWGIDKYFCGITGSYGKKTIRDVSIKVLTDGKSGYQNDESMQQMNNFMEAIHKYIP
jgi:hypothetical protein